MIYRPETFRGSLEGIINAHSKENGSDTPDFVLAEYLADCLDAFDKATKRRTEWYAPAPRPTPTTMEGSDRE